MTDETALLAEMILQADILCAGVETGVLAAKSADKTEVRLKISQCRGILGRLQSRYEEDRLTLADRTVCADFRILTMSLMWVCFYGGTSVSRKLFRKLVQIESGFTYLMIQNVKP